MRGPVRHVGTQRSRKILKEPLRARIQDMVAC